MKILVVTNQSPFPINNGQRVRTSLFLEALHQEHEVDLFIGDYHNEELPYWIGTLYSYSHSTHLTEDVKAFLSGKSIYKERFNVELFKEKIAELDASGTYDLIAVLALPAMAFLPDVCQTPVWLDEHNIEYEIYNEYGKGGHFFKRWFFHTEASRLKEWELSMIQKADKVTLCSTEDTNKLPELLQNKCFVVPNSCPQSGLGKQVSYNWVNPTIIYSGTMNWKPNVDACLYFLDEIWPLIKDAVPNVSFTIMGKNPAKSLLHYSERDSQVSCTGFVESADPYMSRATLSVVPLRMGSGTRIKIIEAARYGIPVVSTSKGAEGLHFNDGESLYIADGAELFAKRCIELLENAELWHRFSDAIYAQFKDEYSREAVTESIVKMAHVA